MRDSDRTIVGGRARERDRTDTKGIHRVLWDLRYQFLYVPPPEDSGFYGPPKAAFVPPGRYTVRLAARGRELIDSRHVRWDPRSAEHARGAACAHRDQRAAAASCRARSTRRRARSTRERRARADARRVRVHWRGADSAAIALLETQVAQLRARGRGGVGSFPGGLFDLLASIESSSLPPTDAQARLITAIAENAATVAAEINDVLATRLPALRARLGARPAATIAPVVPPR